MKNIIPILMICLLVGCSNANTSEQPNNELGTIKEVSAQIELDYFTLDEAINASSHILYCTVTDMEKQNDLYKYRLDVIDRYKGETVSNILMHYMDDSFHIGSDYLMFLNFVDMPLEDERVYMAFTPFCPEVNQDEIIPNFIWYDETISDEFPDLKSLENFVKKVNVTENENIASIDMGKVFANDLENLAINSDIIAEIKVKEIIHQTEVGTTALCHINKVYKGDISKDIRIIMPPDIESGDEAIIFLSLLDDGTYIVNSTSSYIDKDDEKMYDKALKTLITK